MVDWSFLVGNTVINRYVKSLHEVALSSKCEEDILRQISLLKKTVCDLPDFDKILKKVSLLPSEGMIFVNNLSQQLKLSTKITNFLKLLAKNKRLALLTEMCDAYISFVKNQDDVKTFYITYAGEFSEKSQSELKDQLQKIFQGNLECIVRKDDSLIDGVQIQYRSRLLDYSLKSKLNRLKLAMRGESYEN